MSDVPGVEPASLPASDRAPTSAERSRRRDASHGAVLLLGWVGMAVLWVRVLERTGPSILLLAGASVVVCAAVTFVGTSAWIEHNLAIHREKGPRRGVATEPLRYDHDWTGRAVTADWAAVGAATVVVIACSASRKVFLTPTPDEAGETTFGEATVGDRETAGAR